MSDWKGIVAAAALAVATGLAGTWFGYLTTDRELDVRMVEISLAILRTDPANDGAPALRLWAIDTLNNYSEVQIPDAAKAELLNKKLDVSWDVFFRTTKDAAKKMRGLEFELVDPGTKDLQRTQEPAQ